MSRWTLTSFSQGLFSSFSGRKARCLSATFSASEVTVRVTQSRRRVFPGAGGSGRRLRVGVSVTEWAGGGLRLWQEGGRRCC